MTKYIIADSRDILIIFDSPHFLRILRNNFSKSKKFFISDKKYAGKHINSYFREIENQICRANFDCFSGKTCS